ncbi:hypothetical protein [Proteus columbae]|uniref:hypothetical protein n=1 Tax=Proteus columbae TaxID=1987580 RepID=UPI002889ECDC|nr:hypothetical protein [Proteus columbae]
MATHKETLNTQEVNAPETGKTVFQYGINKSKLTMTQAVASALAFSGVGYATGALSSDVAKSSAIKILAVSAIVTTATVGITTLAAPKAIRNKPIYSDYLANNNAKDYARAATFGAATGLVALALNKAFGK